MGEVARIKSTDQNVRRRGKKNFREEFRKRPAFEERFFPAHPWSPRRTGQLRSQSTATSGQVDVLGSLAVVFFSVEDPPSFQGSIL